MGLKNNFFQAMRELFGGEAPSKPDASAADDAGFSPQPSQQRQAPADGGYKAPADMPIAPEYQFEDRMKTMLETSGLVGDDLIEKAQTSTELDSLLKRAASEEDTETREQLEQEQAERERISRERALQEQIALEAAQRQREERLRAERQREQNKYEVPSFKREQPEESYTRQGSAEGYYQPPPRESAEQETFPRPVSSAAEVTVISKNTLVTGNIRSFAGIYIEGNINGNVDVVKNADINGKIIGNVSCSDTRLNGALIQGDIASKGRIVMDKNAMIVGNMSSQSMDIDGKIKGDVEVGGRIGLRENSVIIGNINAGTISITDGANVQGYVNTTFLKENSEMVFPKQITLTEEEGAFEQAD
jgi:cytoskeletal protein CcmA (bactofilin family)